MDELLQYKYYGSKGNFYVQAYVCYGTWNDVYKVRFKWYNKETKRIYDKIRKFRYEEHALEYAKHTIERLLHMF